MIRVVPPGQRNLNVVPAPISLVTELWPPVVVQAGDFSPLTAEQARDLTGKLARFVVDLDGSEREEGGLVGWWACSARLPTR